MLTLDEPRFAKKAEILRLGEKYGARNIRVFGSVARGENRQESDVDFLVNLDKGRTLNDLAGFVADVEDGIDPVIVCGIVEHDIPSLLAAVRGLLGERPG